METESKTRGQQESYGKNTQRLGKELMTIDEITTMPGDRCILQLRGLRPFFSPKYDVKKHPNFKHTAEADKRNAFDTATLFNKKLEVQPNDLFKVYEEDASDETINENEDIFNYDDLDDPDALA